MSYIITFFIGAILGAILIAIMSASGNCNIAEEAYRKGLEDGKTYKKINET